jgi:hypothetical protein
VQEERGQAGRRADAGAHSWAGAAFKVRVTFREGFSIENIDEWSTHHCKLN